MTASLNPQPRLAGRSAATPASTAERLRSHGLLAGSLTMQVAFLRGVSWAAEARTEETDSTLVLMRLLDRLWRDRPEPRCQLLQVGVVLTRFCERSNHTPSLFQTVTDTMASFDTDKQRRLDETIDRLRALRPQGGFFRQRAGQP